MLWFYQNYLSNAWVTYFLIMWSTIINSQKGYDKFHLKNYYDHCFPDHMSLGSLKRTCCPNPMNYLSFLKLILSFSLSNNWHQWLLVEEIRNAQCAKGLTTILAIGTTTLDHCVYWFDYVDYYFRVTKSEHMTKLKKKFNCICKYINALISYMHNTLYIYKCAIRWGSPPSEWIFQVFYSIAF